MPITVGHALTATTPDDPAWEIRPSHWNSAHVATISANGTEIFGAFSNAGNVSFGLETNGFVTASANVTAAPSPVNVTGANGSSVNAQTIAFSNSNGVSLGVSTAANGATITASHNGLTSQSNQAFSAPGGSSAFQTLVFANSNGVSFSNSNGSVVATVATNYQSQGAYLTTARASNDAVGLNSAVSNVTATINSSGLSLDARGYAGTGTSATNASITLNSNGLQISVAAPGAGGGVALYDGANSISTGTARFSNANGVSFGFNGQTITASVAAAGGAQTGISSVAISDATYTSGQISFRDLNGITWGTTTGQAIQITHALQYTSATSAITSNALNTSVSRVAAINGSSGTLSLAVGSSLSSSTNGSTITFGLASNITTALQSAGAYLTTARASNDAIGLNSALTANGVSVTANSSGLSLNFPAFLTTAAQSNHSHGNPTLALTNLTGTTASNSAGFTLSLSAAAAGGGGAANVNLLGANTAGNTTASGSTLGFSGLNLTLSGTNASQLVFSAPATSSLVGTGVMSISTNGSTISLGVAATSFVATGAASVSLNGSTLSIGVPATSFVATGQASVSLNGSTLSIGVANPRTETNGFFPNGDLELVTGGIGNGTMIIDPNAFGNLAFDRVLVPIYNTNATNSSGSHTLSFWFGLYTRNASTLSLYASASQSYAVTHSGTAGSYSQYSAMRNVSIPMTTTVTDGKYWMAFVSRTSSAGTDGTYSNLILSQNSNAYGGVFGQGSNATNQFTLGQGFYSATTSGIPSSIAFSQIQGTNSSAQRMQAILFASGTV